LDKLSSNFSCGKETEPVKFIFLPEVGNAFHYAFNFLLKKRKGVVKNISIKLFKWLSFPNPVLIMWQNCRRTKQIYTSSVSWLDVNCEEKVLISPSLIMIFFLLSFWLISLKVMWNNCGIYTCINKSKAQEI
jgi:hypothetical protein